MYINIARNKATPNSYTQWFSFLQTSCGTVECLVGRVKNWVVENQVVASMVVECLVGLVQENWLHVTSVVVGCLAWLKTRL